MFILTVQNLSGVRSVTTELPSSNLKIDPRSVPSMLPWPRILTDLPFQVTFDITYHNDDDGKTVTITKIGPMNNFRIQARDEYKFRVYNPATENVPSFVSTTYNYLGIKDEKAPVETILGIIDPSVNVIMQEAFCECGGMKFCFIHDNVEVIDEYAFLQCSALNMIKLPNNLRRIGRGAFSFCEEIDAIFVPSSVEKIDEGAFRGCTNMRIFSLPPNMTTDQIGIKILEECDTLFLTSRITGYPQHRFRITWNYQQSNFELANREVNDQAVGIRAADQILRTVNHVMNEEGIDWNFNDHEVIQGMTSRVNNAINQAVTETTNRTVNQSVIDFYDDMPTLHKACLDTNVSPFTIHQCISTHGSAGAYITDHNGMLPLHILTMNPHTTSDSILACLELNKNAAFVSDDSDMTPMDYLWRYESLDCIVSMIQNLCLHREAHTEHSSVDDEDLNPKRQRVKK